MAVCGKAPDTHARCYRRRSTLFTVAVASVRGGAGRAGSSHAGQGLSGHFRYKHKDRQTRSGTLYARTRDVVEGMEVVAYRWPSVRTSILAFFDCNVTRPRASRVTPTPHKCRACAPAALLHLRSLGNSACSLPQACASAALLHLRSLGQTRPVPSRSLNLMASWPRPSRRARARPFTCALYIRC